MFVDTTGGAAEGGKNSGDVSIVSLRSRDNTPSSGLRVVSSRVNAAARTGHSPCGASLSVRLLDMTGVMCML